METQLQRMNRMTDRELLAHYTRDGSPDAFAEIVRRHTEMVYATSLRILRNGHDAEDATQAVFLIFMKKARGIPHNLTLAGWLFRVAENSARNVQTIARRRQRNELEAAVSTSQKPAQLTDEYVRAQLDAALATLPRVQRDAVVLRYLAGKSQADAALELGCPQETFHTRLRRGLEALRAAMARRDVRMSGAVLLLLLERCKEQAAPAALAATIHAACVGKAGVSAPAALAAREYLHAIDLIRIKLAVAGVAAAILVGLVIWNVQKFARKQPAPPVAIAKSSDIRTAPPPVSAPLAANSDAASLSPAAPPAPPNAPNVVDRSLGWLAKSQEDDGHYDSVRFGGASGQDVAVTSLAAMSFLGAGHTARVGLFKPEVVRTIEWLKSHESTDMTQAALRVLALCEHYGMSHRDRDAAQAAVDELCARQSLMGNWDDESAQGVYRRSLSPTSWAILALSSAKVGGLKVPDGVVAKAAESSDSHQPAALANDGNMEGAAMAASIALDRQFTGHGKDDAAIQRMTGVIATQKPAYPAEGIGDEVILWYRGALVMFLQEGQKWKDWNKPLTEALLPSQIKDGDLAGSWNFRNESTPFIWGRVGATALATLCLEIHYRYEMLNQATVTPATPATPETATKKTTTEF